MFRDRRNAIVFHDRQDAGRQLARYLSDHRPEGPLIVLALPRGGLPVAAEVAELLEAPLDILVVRKLGAPFNSELAVGGIAFGGVTVYNRDLLRQLGLDEESLESTRERELEELQRREEAYRGARPPPDLEGKTVIIVDDGVATGATMHAAAMAARRLKPRQIVIAVPTSSVDAVHRLRAVADEVVALATPEPYMAVGAWFERFEQLTDAEVIEYLEQARQRQTGPSERSD
jgi:putative phosphoribosyl transferase